MSKCIKIYRLLGFCLLIILGLGVYNANAGVHFLTNSGTVVQATEDKSCWQQGFRMVNCSGGGCSSCYDSSNKKTYYKKGACNTTGYVNSCPAGQILDPSTQLSCDNSYSSKCICDSSYRYGPLRETCDKTPGGESCTIGSNTYYKTCECPSEYSKTCEAGLEVPVDASDSCGGKYKGCKCITPNVTVGKTCKSKTGTGSGNICYYDCNDEAIVTPPPPTTCESVGKIDVDTYWGGRLRLYGILPAISKIDSHNCISALPTCDGLGYKKTGVRTCSGGQKPLKCAFDLTQIYCPNAVDTDTVAGGGGLTQCGEEVTCSNGCKTTCGGRCTECNSTVTCPSTVTCAYGCKTECGRQCVECYPACSLGYASTLPTGYGTCGNIGYQASNPNCMRCICYTTLNAGKVGTICK